MSQVPAPPTALWRRADLGVLAGAYAAGLMLLGAGYWGASGTRVFDAQVSALRLAALGVVVAQAGVIYAVMQGRRQLRGRRLRSLPDVNPRVADAIPVPAARGTGLVAAPGMTRYHSEGCDFARGKPVTAAPAAAHERAGRRPCGVCLPGGGGGGA